jgi:hypothetical protein
MPRRLSNRPFIRAFVAHVFCAFALLVVLSGVAISQDLPPKIRGYKVYEPSANAAAPVIRLAKPVLRLDGLLSIAVEAGGEFTSPEHGGRIDFLTFHDIRVNGIAVEVDEYRHPFEFKKGAVIPLAAPIRGRIGLTGAAETAFQELRESRGEWRVTGTAFVFGKFKRFGFSFKRVVPVRLDFIIKNPLHS